MKRTVLACAAALVGASMLATTASAAVLPGTYKGKVAGGAAATVTVAGNKVTINVAKFPIKCLAPTGTYTQPSATKYVFKGTIKAGKVSGTYVAPLAGNGEYFKAKGTFYRATKSFVGTLGVVQQMCRGTAAVKAKKA